MAWDNEQKTLFTLVTSPSLWIPPTGPKIFLAGSINDGQAPDWQARISSFIEKEWIISDVTVYNPRRSDFIKSMEEEQQAWSIQMISTADYILMHLSDSGLAPISLLELGLFMNSNRLYISMDEGYERYYSVMVHCNYFGNRNVFSSPELSVRKMMGDYLIASR